MSEKIYAKGVFIKKPENAPEFVLGRVGINYHDFVAFLEEHTKANGWCDFDLLNGDKGPYLVLNTFVPKPKDEPREEAPADDQIPF
ncbi:hypothetical protein [Bradyrhizobium sp. AUGA SZCCT0431]|uniref:hypothetical protein n=1 Tax=Bradyrhizobium sp. AUGA SZCCT0431 TaxID=2807674 RepID=UPI001BA4782F|nr:hypothetical protein [Bradyrhizobium sp. AUGA SZCCT0431]MBR1146658.1 hypothetical protein [Bradyrhizobium sp. AUGA SZCCT0431]